MTNNDSEAEHDKGRADQIEVMIDETIIQAYRARYGDTWKQEIERALTMAAAELSRPSSKRP